MPVHLDPFQSNSADCYDVVSEPSGTTMSRRDFLRVGGSVGGWPVGADAQQSAMPVVGFLSGRSLASDSDLVAAFSRALNETGYVNGQNLAIEFRWADGQLDRLPELAAELIERKVAVLFAGAADVAAGALRVAAATGPVVFATGSDPVAAGLVASFNRPGGNLTGVTGITNALWLKRLELLRELISPTPLIALLVNPNNLTATAARRVLNDATRRIGQDAVMLDASTEAYLGAVFASLATSRGPALVVCGDPLFMNQRAVVVACAALYAIPAIYARREFSEDGGLISFGSSTVNQYYQSGVYVGRIL